MSSVKSIHKEKHFFFKPKKVWQLISEEQRISRLQFANEFFTGKIFIAPMSIMVWGSYQPRF
jgi:hypothetical protein